MLGPASLDKDDALKAAGSQRVLRDKKAAPKASAPKGGSQLSVGRPDLQRKPYP